MHRKRGGVMNELVLVCGQCEKPIGPGTGALGVSYAQIAAYQRDEAGWQEAHPGDVHTGAELMEMPDEVVWHAAHYDCGPEDGSCYEIEAGRLTSWAELTNWTAHLMGKTWLPVTDWDDLLREVSEGTSGRICLIAQVAA
jgi:hypothetical protein